MIALYIHWQHQETAHKTLYLWGWRPDFGLRAVFSGQKIYKIKRSSWILPTLCCICHLYLFVNVLCSLMSQCFQGLVLSPPWSWAGPLGLWKQTTQGSTCLDGSLWWTNIICGRRKEQINTPPGLTQIQFVQPETPFLPCVTLESSVWCYHIDTWWFKGKFTRKYELSMIISP